MNRSAISRRRLDRLHDFAGGRGLLHIAHRGARAYAPENTIPAFEKAAAMGCQMIELDVHLSADGHLVVHHDDDLRRCTDATTRFPGRVSYAISDFTASDIACLDAGAWFLQQLALSSTDRQAFLRELKQCEVEAFLSDGDKKLYCSGSVGVPPLGMILALASSSRLLVNIEIKSIPCMYPGISEKVIDSLEHHGMLDRALVSSFDHEQISHIRSLNQTVATAVLTSDRLCYVAQYLESLDADAFHPGCVGEFDSLGFGSVTGQLETRSIVEVLQSGRDVNVWTCNDASQMQSLVRAGVTGIITDYPNRLSSLG